MAYLYSSMMVLASYTPDSSSQRVSTSLWFLSLQTHMQRTFLRRTVPTRLMT